MMDQFWVHTLGDGTRALYCEGRAEEWLNVCGFARCVARLAPLEAA